jgi:hypothetical protein
MLGYATAASLCASPMNSFDRANEAGLRASDCGLVDAETDMM